MTPALMLLYLVRGKYRLGLLENKVKNRSRMHYQIANLQVKGQNLGNDTMPLLLDEDGFNTESTGANFLMIKGRKLISPELRNMLRGTSAQYILEVLSSTDRHRS